MPSTDSLPIRRIAVRVARWLMAGTMLLALGGCGLGLVYPRLDSVVGFYIRGLVTLDDAQSAELKRTLAGNLEWHRRSELPDYAALLQDLARTVDPGGDRAAWSAASERTERYWRAIFEQAAPGYTALAASFTDAQVAELLGNIEREDDEAWQEFVDRSPEERRTQREKSLRRGIERFTGSLTPAQLERVRMHVASSDPFMAEWRDNRRVWRDALAAALAQRGDGPAFDQRMTVLIARPDELWTAPYRAAIEARRDALIDLIADLDSMLTPKQRASARRKLLALADEVQNLGRDGARRGAS